MHKRFFILTTIVIFFSILVWCFVISNYIVGLGDNFQYSADVISLDNFYDSESKEFVGETNSVTKFQYKTLSRTNGALIIENTFDVKTTLNEQIVSLSRHLAIDKYTGEHVSDLGDRDRTGYLFAPRFLEPGQTFTYWHVNYDAPAEMQFVKEESLQGLTVYRYEADYSDSVIEQTEDLKYLPGVGTTKGVRLEPRLTLWVEPVSGWLVHYKDQTIAYFYDLNTGERIEPWNSFRNFYTEDSIAQQVAQAQNLKERILLARYGVPILLSLIWVINFLSFLLANRVSSEFYAKSFLFLLVLLFSTLLVFGSWWYARLRDDQLYVSNVTSAKNTIVNTITDRMMIYSSALEGVQGLFHASDSVSREEWTIYGDSINLQNRYAGIQGVGYVELLEKSEIPEIENQVRAEGFTDFSVFPLGDRDQYSTILYIYPFNESNRRAFGFDEFSEETRRKALNLSAQTDRVTLTDKVTLVQETDENIQPGFLAYLPVYDDEGKIKGFVYSIYRMYDLMSGIFFGSEAEKIGFKIYDADSVERATEETLIFDSAKLSQTEGLLHQNLPQNSLGHRIVYLFNNQWVFEFFEIGLLTSRTQISDLILVFGVGLVLFLSLAFIFILRSQYRCELEAKRIRIECNSEQDKLKRVIKNLQKKESILLDAQKIADVGNFEFDFQSNTFVCSPEVLTIHGLPERESISLNEYRKLIHPDFTTSFDAHLNSLQSSRGEYSFVYKIMTPEKEQRWIHLKGKTQFDSGAPVKSVGTFQDISDQKKAEESKDIFISLVSQQLRDPLTIIKYTLENIFTDKTDNLTLKQTESLRTIETVTKRMIEIISTLLNIVFIETERPKFEYKTFHPKHVLKVAVERFQNIAKEKQQRISVEIESSIDDITSDPNYLRQVFMSILSNSVKYSPPLAEIEIKVFREGKDIVFQFSDNGFGIPENEKANVFSKFFRGSNIVKYEPTGTGLSLYYVKQIVEMLHGSISLESRKGEGTTVWVKLPERVTDHSSIQ